MTNETIAKQHTPKPLNTGDFAMITACAKLREAGWFKAATEAKSAYESLRQQNAELVRALRMVADAQRSGNYGEAFDAVNAVLATVQS